ncbi:MAG: metallophosphoesterase [Polyangia bacterium]
MPSLARFVLMITIATAVTAGLHYYAYVRLSRYLVLPPPELRILKAVMLGLFALLWLSMPLGRSLPRSVGTPLLWLAYIWMGALVVLDVTFAGSDLVRLAIYLIGKLAPASFDPERRQILGRTLGSATLATATGLIGYALFQGLRPVQVKHVEVPLPRLPRELDGLRVVQITDIHIGPTLDGAWLRSVVERINALKPDVIAITGDLVDGSVARLRDHVRPIGDLKAAHGVYFVTGNHEYYAGADEWLHELTNLGIRVLRNERVTLQPRGGAHFDVAGVDDFHSHGFPGHGPDLPRALSGRDPERPVLLLAHQPLQISEAAKHGVDLQISGHTHGGQIWPWGFFVRLQQPYVAGLHQHGDTRLYISCGTGYWGPPMRLGAPAEITHLVLRSA